jgi:dephospho-CoA kinase
MPKQLWKLGLTGGIGCGKSAAGKHLASLGLAHLDTDQVAREVVAPSTKGLDRLTEVFEETIILPDGSLDRKRLAQLVFADPRKKKKLEDVLHPLIWHRVESFLARCHEEGRHAVVEVPLLFENRRQDAFDRVWVVATSPELQRARLALRNGWSNSEIEARIASQMPLQEKIALADAVLHNTGSLEALHAQIEQLWASLQAVTP